jgi:dTDP-4-dehydrorhamnose reductase
MVPSSNSYLIPKYYTLDPTTDIFQVQVPAGHAHGFFTLAEDTIILYHFNGEFDSDTTTHIHYGDPWINLELPATPTLSVNDCKRNFVHPVEYTIIGASGFLGTQLMKALNLNKPCAVALMSRLEDIDALRQELVHLTPKVVFCAAGLTGTPNIDWCDKHKTETISVNLTGQLALAQLCHSLNIKLVIFGSGGIFVTDASQARKEHESGDSDTSFYSKMRITLESLVIHYPNVTYLRILYPVSASAHPKNLLSKVQVFDTLTECQMSVSCVDTLFPLLPAMLDAGERGIINFVNPGTISLSEIKTMLCKASHVDPQFKITSPIRPCPVLCARRMSNYGAPSVHTATLNAVVALTTPSYTTASHH